MNVEQKKKALRVIQIASVACIITGFAIFVLGAISTSSAGSIEEIWSGMRIFMGGFVIFVAGMGFMA